MTLHDLLAEGYAWLASHGNALLLGAVLVPAIGTIAARLGKAGKTDADGRFIASGVVGVALVAIVLEALGLVLAGGVLGLSLLDVDARVAGAPILCLIGCLIGIRWVFPLSELGSVKMFGDVGLFILAITAVAWLFSKFRGWGLYFVGGLGEALVLGGLCLVLLRRLYQRALRRG